MRGNTLNVPKYNLVLLRVHHDSRNKIQNNLNLNYSSLYQSIRTLMFTQFVQCVGVWCIQSTDDNCSTSRNYPLGIVGTLIQWTQPPILNYLFYQPKKLIPLLLHINIIMAPGPRLGHTLYHNFPLQMKIVIQRPVVDYL